MDEKAKYKACLNCLAINLVINLVARLVSNLVINLLRIKHLEMKKGITWQLST